MLAIEPVRPGTVVHWAVSEVVQRSSSDSAWYTSWDHMLEEKRDDPWYPAVLESIRENGFLRPLTGSVGSGLLQLSDGHHRIAAAIDLGLDCVPVYVNEFHVIADDSGSWRKGDLIETDPTAAEDYASGGRW